MLVHWVEGPRGELDLTEAVGGTCGHRPGCAAGRVLHDCLRTVRRVMEHHAEVVALIEEFHLVRVWGSGRERLELQRGWVGPLGFATFGQVGEVT